MEIGVIDYLLRVREEACFYMAQELGFSALEFAVDQIGDPTRMLFQPQRQDELLELQKATGISVRSLYATHFVRESLFATVEPVRQHVASLLEELAAAAERIRASTVVIPLFGASECPSDPHLPAFAAVLEHLAGMGTARQIRFAFKTTHAAAWCRTLLDRVRSPWIGVCFDPGNAAVLGRDPVDEVRILGEHLLHVHLKDRTAHGASVALGEGILDLEPVLAALPTIRYEGPIILETPSAESAIESAKTNLAYLRSLLPPLPAAA